MEDAEKSQPSSPRWIDLPRELTEKILLRLDTVDILENAENVCTSWNTICNDPSMWRVIRIENNKKDKNYDTICRCAVDRSQGQLIEIKIIRFGSDELLRYISDRSSRLRHLEISCILSPECVSASVGKFPHLQELNISVFVPLTAENIENIEYSCPDLKSVIVFFYSRRDSTIEDCNTSVKAIAENMPGLRKLRVEGSKMSKDGLQAIIDGCPNLELLDIGYHNSVDRKSDVWKRCIRRIKEVRVYGQRYYNGLIDSCSWTITRRHK